MAADKWQALCRVLQRRRVYSEEQLEAGTLRRCLSIWDVLSLGVGSTLGVGVYVLLGSVALNVAGPSVVISFFIAAVAALFAGLCYSEVSSRVPRAGSAYTYAYVALGEVVAFIVGWNMVLEALFGTASLARGLSLYVDFMSNRSLSAWFESIAPMAAAPFSQYFDFLAFFLVIIIGCVLAAGVRESTMVNNVFTALNVLLVLFVIVLGAFGADPSNWKIPASEVTAGAGWGGFFPYGAWGTLRGAAICFYGYVGFDVISFTAEEVKEPRRVIPVAILTVVTVVFVLYANVATVVTMMVPYHVQDTVAAVAMAFSHVGWEWAKWVASVGAIFGILGSLFGSLYPLPRLLYSMAADGLMFPCLATVTASRRSPLVATLLPTAIIAVLGAVLDLNELVMMMCLGTLLSYSVVATCVIVLRYRSKYEVAGSRYLKQMVGLGERLPSTTTTTIVYINLVLFASSCFAIGVVVEYSTQPLVFAIVLHVVAALCVVSMALQPQIQEELAFQTPLVPVVPCLSIYVNIQLMVLLNVHTWIRVLVWTAIGVPVYIICVCCFKQKESGNLDNNLKNSSQANGKSVVHIYVESPTPPGSIKSSNNGGDKNLKSEPILIQEITVDNNILNKQPIVTEEIMMQQAYIEDNDEKEAKIIDMLDQVLQAEEDSYGEIISLKEQKAEEADTNTDEPVLHRHSITELSDAGSDASMGNLVLSKYDVIAQVHREDLPKVTEEEEKNEKEETNEEAFNDNDSRTDESGYSDTIDKSGLNESIIDSKEDIPNIPIPPPLDENFFANPTYLKSYTIPARPSKPKPIETEEEKPRESIKSNKSIDDTPMGFGNIPIPPPLDENFFASPTFKKSYTISARPSKSKSIEMEEEKPRESIKSNNSMDDTPMVFGSDKQLNFMSKLNNIFQNKISTNDNDEQRRRSNSTGNVVENTEVTWIKDRPPMLPDLKKEIVSRETAQNLKRVANEDIPINNDDDDDDENSLSKNDLKSKLESIFAAGGPKLPKTRIMQSNPPTPEEAYQTDTSSSESVTKLPHMEKNDTLKRQKTKFGEVLNSFRLTLNKDDEIL